MTRRGSLWRRWEPHIHAPGTVLNDQFGGADPWNTYLTSLETATPKIEAIAVTDYYVTDTYEEVLRRKDAGRLPTVQLILPNVELRLDVAARTGFVNLHLLVSPEDADHLAQLRRILARLKFSAFGDQFDCTREELIRLGKRAGSTGDDRRALECGATQFKVNFSLLREVFNQSDWAKANILVAVAGGADDGTSGLRQAADATIRQEIEKFAHIIFASSTAQREFWLGRRSASPNALRERYDGCKPCLHGCDAHDHKATGQPGGERYSWIKGAPTFDALRQACIDPGLRAYVGAEPPRMALPSQMISTIEIVEAPWAATPCIPLNSGLVAIIGARGSGKTALADMIAAGCDAIPAEVWIANEDISPSFLMRARPLIGNARVQLTWGGGSATTRRLDGEDANGASSYARARYLSQQFVEELCSSKGASEGLVREIERVIYESHPDAEREGAADFEELRKHRTMRYQQARQREVDSIAAISQRIADELEKEASVAALSTQVGQKSALIKGYESDLQKLVVKGTEEQAKRHAAINDAIQKLNSKIAKFNAQRRAFVAIQDEVKTMRATKAPEMLRDAQARHSGSGLDSAQWQAFLLVYQGDVDAALAGYINWADGEIHKLTGVAPAASGTDVPLIAQDADLGSISLALLKAEIERLERHISADTVVRNQYAALAKRIATESGALQTLKSRLEDAEKAADRRKTLQDERQEAYGRLFDAILGEQRALAELYAPLMNRLVASTGTLQKLRFSVARTADAAAWAEAAERNLIDCRKSGPFFGRGSLVKLAVANLKSTWETGTAAEIQKAIGDFITTYSKDLLAHAPVARAQQAEFRAWLVQFAHWLFRTEHITVRHEISYDGVDIRKLSPGTRGIVLLLLYLALDDSDDRPLIIDQPEENLDPKSVYDELVALFVEAKSKRQVIIVTHNANLVINTDADQVIVANASPHPAGGLPAISYRAGGLEDTEIRALVCDILEGGEAAFRERARRLRVRLAR